MASDTPEQNGGLNGERHHVTPPAPDNTSSPDLPGSPIPEDVDKEMQNPKGTKEITPPPSEEAEDKVNPERGNPKEDITQCAGQTHDAAFFLIIVFIIWALFSPCPPRSDKKDVGTDTNEDSTTSDNDTGERPVRQKLKETTIAGTSDASTGKDTSESRASSRGRASRKRSFDDLQAESKDAATESKDDVSHRRKRSRDSKAEEVSTPPEQPRDVEDASKQILSPKKKRSIDQLDSDDIKADNVTGKPTSDITSENGVSGDKARIEGEPEKKRHRDNSQELGSTVESEVAPSKPSLPNAFSNTSAVSPFASLAPKSDKEEESSKTTHTTSASAFASSSFGAFASSEQSPFGSLGSTPSVFSKPAAGESEKPGFAAPAGPSPFATPGVSSFGALGSGFAGFAAAAPKPAGGLTSFAAPGGPGILGGAPKAKPFGSLGANSAEEVEEDEGKTRGEVASFEKGKGDERFFKQETETGEEEETTYFSCKAKLFGFSGKEWKERGIGTFKVNVKEPAGDATGKKTARMIMRADGVLRVMLNTPIFKGMTVGDASGNEPTNKQLHLASLENGRSVPLLLRTGSEEFAKELYNVVRKLQEEL